MLPGHYGGSEGSLRLPAAASRLSSPTPRRPSLLFSFSSPFFFYVARSQSESSDGPWAVTASSSSPAGLKI
jgi:hypothetical protein